MRKKMFYLPIVVFMTIFGIVFGILTNLFFDGLVSKIWIPLAIAILFFVFSALVAIIVFFFSEHCGSRSDNFGFKKILITYFTLLFILTMAFEFIYELGLQPIDPKGDSYIFILDDSGSMVSNDPDKMRVTAVERIVAADNSNTPYAIYSFADDTKRIRGMLPENSTTDDFEMLSDGGTQMLGALTDVFSDIASNVTKTYDSTKVILLSDGDATDIGFFDKELNAVLKEYATNNLVISTVGLGRGVNESLMRRIADNTGGVYVHADGADDLVEAMNTAVENTASRNLLGTRGYCKTNFLHAVMRVVFIAIIGLLLSGIKIWIYGSYYKPNVILLFVLSVLAGLWMEISIETFGISENLARVVMWILLSITLIEKVEYIRLSHNEDSVNSKGGDRGNNFDAAGNMIKGKSSVDLQNSNSII